MESKTTFKAHTNTGVGEEEEIKTAKCGMYLRIMHLTKDKVFLNQEERKRNPNFTLPTLILREKGLLTIPFA